MKGTKTYSIFRNKCPRCQEGDFFIHKNAYKLRTFDKMHDKCPHCGEDFIREPGYYYGAMYVSYALNVALGVGFYILTSVILKLSPWYVFLPGFPVLVLLMFPVVFRWARLTWINFFVRYQKPSEKASELKLKP